jgi:hypothetical protein
VGLPGEDLPGLLAAIEDEALCPRLAHLGLSLRGSVPVLAVLDVLGTAGAPSRVLRMGSTRLSVDPSFESSQCEDLLSPALWEGGDRVRQQAAALLLSEMLQSTFTLLGFLPFSCVEAATTGALRLLVDPRRVLPNPVLLRFLGELVEVSARVLYAALSRLVSGQKGLHILPSIVFVSLYASRYKCASPTEIR